MPSQDQQYEEQQQVAQKPSFSDLALAKFIESWPNLLNMLDGFTDMTEQMSNPQDTMTGCFKLTSGNEAFWVPVVAKGDSIGSIDSFYTHSTGMFMPLTNMSQSLIVNSQQQGLGEAADIPASVDTNPSIQKLVTPPITSKTAYASHSRLVEFMAAMPSEIKDQVLSHINSDISLARLLNDTFGLGPITQALKYRASVISRPKLSPISITVITDTKPSMPTEVISNVLTQGYHVLNPEAAGNRLSFSQKELETTHEFRELSSSDVRTAFNLVTGEGTLVKAIYLPGTRISGSYSDTSMGFILTELGEVIPRSNITYVIAGKPLPFDAVARRVFSFLQPTILKDYVDGDILALESDLSVIDLLHKKECATLVRTADGCQLNCREGTLIAYNNYKQKATKIGSTIFIRPDTLLLSLPSRSVYDHIDKYLSSISMASKLVSFSEKELLGDSISLTHDGIDFSINGDTVRSIGEVVSRLLVSERLPVERVQSMIKEAKEDGYSKIYLSKQASDISSGSISQSDFLADANEDKVYPYNINKSSLSSRTLGAATLGSKDAVEATVISELLQTPDMFELISEYLPDIAKSVDRLGRILFTIRFRVNELSDTLSPDKVATTLANLKNVYKNLGESYLRLQHLSAIANVKY